MTVAGQNRKSMPESPWARLQRQSRRVIVATFVLSGLFHLASYIKLGDYGRASKMTTQQNNQPIKIRMVEKPKEKQPSPDAFKEKILETPQAETEKPVEASHLGNVNHTAEKETKVDVKKQAKALDPGQKGNPEALSKPAPPKVVKSLPEQKVAISTKTGTVSINQDKAEKNPRNAYESLLPSSINDLYGQVNAGYQDYINEDIDIGDRIDINTSEYRFIGYFTGMRKAIELVWNYPSEASMRGMQGEVGLEFAINKDGTANRIRVLKSSGYDVLDRAIVEAIKLASPFSPLPNGFGKNRIVVTGSFRYILSAYGTH